MYTMAPVWRPVNQRAGKTEQCSLERNLERMVISILIHIERMKHVVRTVGLDVSRVDVVRGVDRDEMSGAIYCVDVNDSDISQVARTVAWADDPHPSGFIRAFSDTVKPVDNSAWIERSLILERKETQYTGDI